MTKTEYAAYLASEYWQERRKRAIQDAGHQCEECCMPRWLASLVYDQDLHVHHVSYERLGMEEDSDLMSLCRRCHDIETFGRSDFRKPSQATCSACECKHFNVYSELCDGCSFLVDGPVGSMLGKLLPSQPKLTYAKSLLCTILRFYADNAPQFWGDLADASRYAQWMSRTPEKKQIES